MKVNEVSIYKRPSKAGDVLFQFQNGWLKKRSKNFKGGDCKLHFLRGEKKLKYIFKLKHFFAMYIFSYFIDLLLTIWFPRLLLTFSIVFHNIIHKYVCVYTI